MKTLLIRLLLVCSVVADAQNIEMLYSVDKSIPSYISISNEAEIYKKRASGNEEMHNNKIKELLQLNEKTSVELVDTLTDIAGGFHESFKELYDGIEIEGSRFTIHYNREGKVLKSLLPS